MMALMLAMAGCGDRRAPSSGDAMRIITLAPALTQMVIDLGLTDALVGVAENDMAAPPGLPVVGNFTDVNTERLIAQRPTHVLMTTGKEGLPPRLHDLAASGHFELIAHGYPGSIDDVVRTLYDPSNPASIGSALGKPQQAMELRHRLLASLDTLRKLTADRPHPRVLLVIGTGPLMASGPGTVHDELLEYVGAVNAAAHATVPAPTYDREALLALNPQVILLLTPSGADVAERLPELAGLPIDAVRDGRVMVLHDPLIMLPSTSLARIGAKIARAIHPELADAIQAVDPARPDIISPIPAPEGGSDGAR